MTRSLNANRSNELIDITSGSSAGDVADPAQAADPGRPALMQFGQEDVFGSLKALKGWQACWLRAIGLVWKNPELQEHLVTDPHGFFRDHCGYEVPPTLHILVERDDGSAWNEDQKSQMRWKIRPTQLTVFLPNAPRSSSDWAIAMADFESIGTAMPFSFGCC